MNRRRTTVVACLALLFAACDSQYRGDGKLVRQARKYSRLVKSSGFMLELPTFRPTRDQVLKYRLDGLPRMNKEMTVAIVTLIPKERIPPSELEKHDFTLPSSHRLTCELVDERNGRIIARNSSVIDALPMTSILSLRHAPFVKQVLHVPTDAIARRAKLVLHVRYEVGGEPLDREMFMMVINEAPLL
jgi:hypothetical protein